MSCVWTYPVVLRWWSEGFIFSTMTNSCWDLATGVSVSSCKSEDQWGFFLVWDSSLNSPRNPESSRDISKVDSVPYPLLSTVVACFSPVSAPWRSGEGNPNKDWAGAGGLPLSLITFLWARMDAAAVLISGVGEKSVCGWTHAWRFCSWTRALISSWINWKRKLQFTGWS